MNVKALLIAAGGVVVMVVAAVVAVVVSVVSMLGGIVSSQPVSSSSPTPPAAIIALDETVSTAPSSLVPCHVSAALLLAQQEVESGYNPTALSPAGAVGLAQFEPSTFPTYALPVPPGGVTPPTPLDPVDAVYAEARMLCANGVNTDPTAALIIYNCGSVSPACISASTGYADEIEQLAVELASTTLSTPPKGGKS